MLYTVTIRLVVLYAGETRVVTIKDEQQSLVERKAFGFPLSNLWAKETPPMY